MTRTKDHGPAPLERGCRVEVREPGYRPWSGEVIAVKLSRISGWWADVRTDDGLVTAVNVEENDLEVIA